MGAMPRREGDVWWSYSTCPQPPLDATSLAPISQQQLEDWIADTVGWKAVEISAEALTAASAQPCQVRPLVQASFQAAARLKTRKARFSQVDLDSQLARCVAQALAAYPNLKVLTLQELNVYDEAVAALASGVQGSEHLVKLCVATCDLGDSGWEALLGALAANTSLRHLKVRRCLARPGATAVALHARSWTALQVLDLGDNPGLGDPDAARLCAGLQLNSSVTALSLRACGISAPGAEAVAALLRRSHCVRELDMSKNQLTAQGCDCLARAVAFSPCLHRLAASHTGWDDAAVSQLASSLATCLTLSCLDLGCGRVSEAGAQVLAYCAKRGGSLQQVALSGNCMVGTQGVRVWAEALGAAGCGLTHLALADCEAGDPAAFALAQALRGNTRLEQLDVSSNQFTAAGVSLLIAAARTTASAAAAAASRGRANSLQSGGNPWAPSPGPTPSHPPAATTPPTAAPAERPGSPPMLQPAAGPGRPPPGTGLALLDVSFNWLGPRAMAACLQQGQPAAAAQGLGGLSGRCVVKCEVQAEFRAIERIKHGDWSKLQLPTGTASALAVGAGEERAEEGNPFLENTQPAAAQQQQQQQQQEKHNTSGSGRSSGCVSEKPFMQPAAGPAGAQQHPAATPGQPGLHVQLQAGHALPPGLDQAPSATPSSGSRASPVRGRVCSQHWAEGLGEEAGVVQGGEEQAEQEGSKLGTAWSGVGSSLATQASSHAPVTPPLSLAGTPGPAHRTPPGALAATGQAHAQDLTWPALGPVTSLQASTVHGPLPPSEALLLACEPGPLLVGSGGGRPGLAGQLGALEAEELVSGAINRDLPVSFAASSLAEPALRCPGQGPLPAAAAPHTRHCGPAASHAEDGSSAGRPGAALAGGLTQEVLRSHNRLLPRLLPGALLRARPEPPRPRPLPVPQALAPPSAPSTALPPPPQPPPQPPSLLTPGQVHADRPVRAVQEAEASTSPAGGQGASPSSEPSPGGNPFLAPLPGHCRHDMSGSRLVVGGAPQPPGERLAAEGDNPFLTQSHPQAAPPCTRPSSSGDPEPSNPFLAPGGSGSQLQHRPRPALPGGGSSNPFLEPEPGSRQDNPFR